MLVPNRHGSSNSYRYGFQGQEKDDEIKGEGNSLNYTFRMHDPRVGRFFAVDKIASNYPWNSPYAFSENRVVDGVELEGLEVQVVTGTIGFVAGAGFELGGQMFANYLADKPLFEKIDWGDVLISGGEGALIGCGIPPIVVKPISSTLKVTTDYIPDDGGFKYAGASNKDYKKSTHKVMGDALGEAFSLSGGHVVSNFKPVEKLVSKANSKGTDIALNLVEKGKINNIYDVNNITNLTGTLVESPFTMPVSSLGNLFANGVTDKYESLNSKSSTFTNRPKYDMSKINRIYIVKSGDTLGELAKKYGRTVEGIAHQNKIADPNKIEVGQELRL